MITELMSRQLVLNICTSFQALILEFGKMVYSADFLHWTELESVLQEVFIVFFFLFQHWRLT